MKPIMVVGRTGAGKTSLLKALTGRDEAVRKTQMVEFWDWAVDTPGEYAEIPRFYNCLIATSMQTALILVVHDAVAPRATFPPGFCRVFRRPVVGVVTKVDRPDARPERAEAHLQLCGVSPPYFRVSALTGQGLDELSRQIAMLREEGTSSDI